MNRPSFSTGTSIVFAVLVSSTSTHADQPKSKDEERLLRGKAAVAKAEAESDANNCPAALQSLDEAEELVRSPNITYLRAVCEGSIGLYTRAKKHCWVALQGKLQGTAGIKNPRPTREAAVETLAEVTKQVSTANFTITPRGACIRVDGRPLEPDPAKPSTMLAGTASAEAPCTVDKKNVEVLLDPGVHAISISAPRRITHTFDLRLRSGETRSYPVFLERDPYWTFGLGSLSAGITASLIGAGFGIAAMYNHNKSESQCYEGRCSKAGISFHKQAQKFGDVSTGVLTLGGAFTAAGVGLLLFSYGRTRPASTSLTVAPTLTGGCVSLQGAF